MIRLLLALLVFCIPSLASAAILPEAECRRAIEQADKEDKAPEEWTGFYRIDGDAMADPAGLEAALRKRSRGKAALVVGGKFVGWNMKTVPMTGTCFLRSDLDKADLSGVWAPGIGFVGANLNGAKLSRAHMAGILVRESDLTGVDASGANLIGGVVDGSWDGSLTGLNLTGARLDRFAFNCSITISDGCPLDRSGMVFANASLVQADIARFSFWDADFTGAKLDRTRVSPGQIHDLRRAALPGPVLLVGGNRDLSLTPAEFSEIAAASSMIEGGNDAPGFDCAKASSAVEKRICAPESGEVRGWDRRLNALYARVVKGAPNELQRQRAWLKERESCATAADNPMECLRTVYDRRLEQLLVKAGEPATLKVGERVLFVEEEVYLSPAFRTTPLFAKIAPILAEAADYAVLVTRTGAKTWHLAGEGVGANGHSCTAAGEADIMWNAATAWYAGKRGKANAPVFRLLDGQAEKGSLLEVFAGGHPDYEVNPDSGDYVGCGARAYFPVMRRIDLSQAQLEIHAKRFAEEY